MSRTRLFPLLICTSAALLLAACATVVEQRVETGLVDAGIPAGPAACMADRWAGSLSTDQIRGIARFADAVKDEGRTLTARQLIGHAAEWNDPQALQVVVTSAARCAFE